MYLVLSKEERIKQVNLELKSGIGHILSLHPVFSVLSAKKACKMFCLYQIE